MAGVAAGLLDARGGVHRVADQRDLRLEHTEFADRHHSAMEPGAELGPEPELALVVGPPRGEARARREAGADRRRRGAGAREPPGGDDLVADIFVDLAAF